MMQKYASMDNDAFSQEFYVPPTMPYVEIRTTLNSSKAYAKHFHPSTLSIGIILKGTTFVTGNNSTFPAKEGDLVVIGPEVVHCCNPEVGKTRSYHMLHVDAGWAGNEDQSIDFDSCANSIGVLTDSPLFPWLLSLTETICAGEETREEEFTIAIRKILEVYRKLPLNKDPQASVPVKRGRALLLGNPETRCKIGHVANTTGLCRESFSRSFHKCTGLPPGVYRHCAKLAHARKLLRNGVSIIDAALASGYADQSHFHRTFVKFFAATPKQYQKSKSHLFKK